jgi:hypothetical protein
MLHSVETVLHQRTDANHTIYFSKETVWTTITLNPTMDIGT